MQSRERAEREHLGLAVSRGRRDLGESDAELGDDFVPGVAHGVGVGLRED